MSMIGKLIGELRELEKTSEFLFGSRTDVPRVAREAAETIEELSGKIAATNMERSSQYYNGGWIPVEERFPEKNGMYLVATGNTAYDMYTADYSEGVWGTGFAEEDDCVIAWMPLPEPYKGGDTQK